MPALNSSLGQTMEMQLSYAFGARYTPETMGGVPSGPHRQKVGKASLPKWNLEVIAERKKILGKQTPN